MTAPLRDVLLVGCGAVGVVYSLILKQSGRVRVTAIARSNFEAVKRDGLEIRSRKYGYIHGWRPDRLFNSLSQALDREYAYVAVATKAIPEITSTPDLLAPLLGPSYKFPQPVYVLLQNGMGIEKDLHLAAVKLDKGTPRILHGAVWIATNLVAPNVIVHGDFDRMSLGIYRPPPDHRKTNSNAEAAILADFAGILRDGKGVVTVVDDIQSVKYAKNYWNAAFGTCSALARHPLMAFFQPSDVDAQITPVLRSVLLELQAVGRAMGFDDIELPTSALDTLERTRKLHQNPDETFKPSMLIDLEKGRPMELEVVVGYVIEKEKELKVDVPRLELIYGLLSVAQTQILAQNKM
jgi:2-dehydropantoate 2-reductase